MRLLAVLALSAAALSLPVSAFADPAAAAAAPPATTAVAPAPAATPAPAAATPMAPDTASMAPLAAGAPATTASASTNADLNRIECRTTPPPTGTRLGGGRECHTVRQWNERMEESQRALVKEQQTGFKSGG